MTLYSKWSLGKNIMFLAGVVMLICIFIPWSNVTDLQSQLVGSLSPIYDGSEVESMVDMMQRANTMSNLRWLMLIPMAYPVYCLFTERYLKNVCCISALVAILYPILVFVTSTLQRGFLRWLLLCFSLVPLWLTPRRRLSPCRIRALCPRLTARLPCRLCSPLCSSLHSRSKVPRLLLRQPPIFFAPSAVRETRPTLGFVRSAAIR